MYTYISSLLRLPPTLNSHHTPLGHHRAQAELFVLCSSFPLAIYLYDSVYIYIYIYIHTYIWASLIAQLVKNLPAVQETPVQSLGWEDPLVKGKATHSSILAWRISWTV